MKQTFKLTILACIAIACQTLQAQAQDVAIKNFNTDLTDLVANLNAQSTGVNAAVNVDAKVLHAFDKSYRNAENVTWFLAQKGYLARFNLNGIESYASFNKNGHKFYDVHFGKDKDLPAGIRDLLKLKYKNGQVYQATEVNSEYQNAWLVNLKDADNLIVARVMDETVDEFSSTNIRQGTQKTRKAHIVIPADH